MSYHFKNYFKYRADLKGMGTPRASNKGRMQSRSIGQLGLVLRLPMAISSPVRA